MNSKIGQGSRRPNSRIIDIALLLTALSTIATADFMFSHRSHVTFLACGLAVAGSVLLFSVLPYLKSRPLTVEELEKLGIADDVHVRASSAGGFRALDLIFLRCILVPADIRDRDPAEAHHQVAHERGHLRDRDPLFFHYIFPTVLASALVALAVSAFIPTQVFSNPLSDAVADRSAIKAYGYELVSIVGIVYPLLAFGVALQTLRDREFSADHRAELETGPSYRQFLDHQVLLEKFRRPNGGSTRLWNLLTHPTFRRRAKSLDTDQSVLTRPTITFGVAFSLMMAVQIFNVMIGGFGGGLVVATSQVSESANPSKLSVAASFIPFIAMFISFLVLGAWLSMVAANSVQNDTLVRQFAGACRSLPALIIIFPLIGWFALLVVPESEITVGFNPTSMVAYFHLAIALVALLIAWNIWKAIFNKVNFSIIIHLVVGAFSLFVPIFLF